MANFQALWSSNSDEYATPQDLFDELNAEFDFNLDVAANEYNHKCKAYFDAKIDGLSQNWGGAEYSAIHHIRKLKSGSKKHFTRARKTTQSL